MYILCHTGVVSLNYDYFQVPPLELETLLQLYPGVCDAGVVGKPVPDCGEEPTAFVVKQPGSNITEQELVDYIAEEVISLLESYTCCSAS